MEYTAKLQGFGPAPGDEQVALAVEKSRTQASRNENIEVYKLCYGCIDLTSLGVTDSAGSITEMTRRAVEFSSRFPGVPDVASICVYPNFVDTVGVATGDSGIRITSVGGGFPSSQTYLEVKMLEVAMAVENGADEIDIVMNVGQMLLGDYEPLANEIEIIKAEAGEEVTLKVIIESGALKTPELIWNASILVMLAGADFVKTSTGKTDVAATPEAAAAICMAIKTFHDKTGKKTGFKAAGGIRTPQDAALYYTIVETILGKEWLSPALFRIGASAAANNLLTAITGSTVEYY